MLTCRALTIGHYVHVARRLIEKVGSPSILVPFAIVGVCVGVFWAVWDVVRAPTPVTVLNVIVVLGLAYVGWRLWHKIDWPQTPTWLGLRGVATALVLGWLTIEFAIWSFTGAGAIHDPWNKQFILGFALGVIWLALMRLWRPSATNASRVGR